MKDFDIAYMTHGQRAEVLTAWYLRFNGFFPLPGFILQDGGRRNAPGGALTEADVLAVRLPHARELFETTDGDPIEVQRDEAQGFGQGHGLTDFVIAEVCAHACKWQWLEKPRSEFEGHLRYCLRRFGQWQEEHDINNIAALLVESTTMSLDYPQKHPLARVKLISVGRAKSELPMQQILFDSMLAYMQVGLFACFDRLRDPDERLYSDNKQWHPLITQVYRRLRPRVNRTKERLPDVPPEQVVEWLFSSAG